MFYFKIPAGEKYRTTYAIRNATQPLMIFGSSRATHHYNPVILEDELKLNSYNAGRDGHSIFYNYAILESVLQRTKPKVVILELDMDGFEYSENTYSRLSALLPYYHQNDAVHEIVDLKSRFEKIKTLSSLYRYNSMLLSIVGNNLLSRKDSDFKNSYLPLIGTWPNSILKGGAVSSSLFIDTVKINYFKSFLRRAKAAGSSVFVFVSPVYLNFSGESHFEMAAELCRQENIPFTDYSQSAFFLSHREYFKDEWHLNKEGAEIYTRLVASAIKSKISLDDGNLD